MSKDFTIKPGGNLKDAVRHQVVLPSEAHSIIGMLKGGTQAESDLKGWIVDDFEVVL
jgi:hypothetical protein